MKKIALLLFTLCLLATSARSAAAQAAKPKSVNATCVESIPKGATRPEMTEAFPAEAFTGYAATLELTVTHGRGEVVLPNGFKLERSSDAYRAVERAGFAIATGGPTETTIESKEQGDVTVTRIAIPIVLLPKAPGRISLVLPPLPITVARASNEVMTLCTQIHEILAQDPTGNEEKPEVRPNAPPRPQREDWPFLRNLVIGIAIGLLVGLVVAWLVLRYLRRPKPAKIVPRELPWIVALRELEAIKRSSLLAEDKKTEFYDSVSDCVRKYLGARYGFEKLGIDGLETTTNEMRTLLKRVWPSVPGLRGIMEFLEECDLVKFARLTPTEADCLGLFAKAEGIVKTTKPELRAETPDAPAGPPSRPPPAPRAPPPPPPEARA